MNEPELASGDSGAHVEQLQIRLRALGRYAGALDGSYGEQTEAAVVELQKEKGLMADGQVGAETWAALGEAEAAAGLLDHAPALADDGRLVPGVLSEDQQWRWDGERWELAHGEAVAAVTQEEAGTAAHISEDGQWLWDGSGWQPVKQTDARG